MEKLRKSMEHIEQNTLKGTKEALKPLFEIATEASSKEIKELFMQLKKEPETYFLSLFLAASLINEGRDKEAFEIAINTLHKMEGNSMRVLDGVIANLWTVVRVTSDGSEENLLPLYLRALYTNREYRNVESTTVLINTILMHLQKKEMYDEAYTFLKHTQLPEGANVGHSSIFYYLSSIVYLMAEEYAKAEEMINQAIVKSVDNVFVRQYKKVYLLAILHQGKHPSREFFRSAPGLDSYQKLLLTIKSCSIEMFYRVLEMYKEEFKKDFLYQAVSRLETAVQKENVRRIGVVYNRISISAVASILEVSEESAIFLLQKAISEDIISGRISMESSEYISEEEEKRQRGSLPVEEMLTLANNLAMLKRHEPVKRKTLDEMKTEMMYNEYQM